MGQAPPATPLVELRPTPDPEPEEDDPTDGASWWSSPFAIVLVALFGSGAVAVASQLAGSKVMRAEIVASAQMALLAELAAWRYQAPRPEDRYAALGRSLHKGVLSNDSRREVAELLREHKVEEATEVVERELGIR